MTQKIYNQKFKDLYIEYSTNTENLIEKEELLKDLFYSFREPVISEVEGIKDELVYLKELLLEHIDESNRNNFMLFQRRLYNQYGWDNDTYESKYNEQELDFIAKRDANISIIIYMFCIYSQIKSPIETAHPAGVMLNKIFSLVNSSLEGFEHDKKTFELLSNCIKNCLETSIIAEDEKERIIKKINKINS